MCHHHSVTKYFAPQNEPTHSCIYRTHPTAQHTKPHPINSTMPSQFIFLILHYSSSYTSRFATNALLLFLGCTHTISGAQRCAACTTIILFRIIIIIYPDSIGHKCGFMRTLMAKERDRKNKITRTRKMWKEPMLVAGTYGHVIRALARRHS